jgi:hypothetical protein
MSAGCPVARVGPAQPASGRQDPRDRMEDRLE